MMPGRLQGDSGQLAAQVRLMEGDGRAAVLVSFTQQPPQGHLVGGSQEDQGPGDEIWALERELDGSVRGLHGLHAGGKIGAGDQVQPGYLWVIHTLTVTHGQPTLCEASEITMTMIQPTTAIPMAMVAVVIARRPSLRSASRPFSAAANCSLVMYLSAAIVSS